MQETTVQRVRRITKEKFEELQKENKMTINKLATDTKMQARQIKNFWDRPHPEKEGFSLGNFVLLCEALGMNVNIVLNVKIT